MHTEAEEDASSSDLQFLQLIPVQGKVCIFIALINRRARATIGQVVVAGISVIIAIAGVIEGNGIEAVAVVRELGLSTIVRTGAGVLAALRDGKADLSKGGWIEKEEEE